MAKGNDGNYLQHSVEVALAASLAKEAGCLHIMLTHGMAPAEPCGPLPSGQTRRLLDGALAAAAGPQQISESAIISAYRITEASREAYPNSGELIAATVGRSKLSGGVAEVCEEKYTQLLRVWQGSEIRVMNVSWRSPTFLQEYCAYPRPCVKPWLLSMDPMTFCANGSADDGKLYAHDRSRIVDTLERLAASGQPGAMTIFVYAVRPHQRPHFWSFVDVIAEHVGMSTNSLWVTHQGGNRNLCAILRAKGADLPNPWPPDGIKKGRSAVGTG